MTNAPQSPPIDPLAATIVDWARFFRRHLLAFAIVFVASAAISVIYTLRQPNRYTASASIMPYVPPPAIAGASELIGGTAVETTPFEMATLYSQVAMSRSIMAALSRLTYQGEPLGQVIARQEGEASLADRELIEILRGMFRIDVNPRTSFVTVSATHRDPEFAASVLSKLLKEMNDYMQRRTDKGMTYARELLETRLEQVAAHLADAQERLEAFEHRHGDATRSAELESEHQALLADVLAVGRLHEEIEDQLELAQVAERHYQSVVHVLDAPEVPLHKSGPPRAKTVSIFVLVCMLAALVYLRAHDAVQRYLKAEVRASEAAA